MSIASSLYCFLCLQVYDDENQTPCQGKCSHIVCEECKNSDKLKKCPNCEEKWEFSSENYAAKELINALKAQFTEENYMKFVENVKTLGAGVCSRCRQSSEKGDLRICTDCLESEGLLFHTSRDTWILKSRIGLTGEKLFNRARSKAFCADCALEGYHKGHKLVKLASVENLSSNMKEKLLLVQGQLAGENMTERVRNDPEIRKFPEVLEKIELFQDLAHKYEMWTYIEGTRKLQECIFYDGLGYPDLISIKRDSYQKALKIYEFNDKLRGYKLRLDNGILKKWIKHFSELEIPERPMEKLSEIKNKLIRLSEHQKFQLEPEDVQNIEQEMRIRLKELVKEQKKDSFLKLISDSLFWKYRSIIQEIKDSEEERLKAEKNLVEEDRKLDLEMEKFDGECNSEGSLTVPEYLTHKKYLLHMDFIDKSLKLDAALIRIFLASRRGLLCQIMRCQCFPKFPDISCDKKLYNCFINEVEKEADFWKDFDPFEI